MNVNEKGNILLMYMLAMCSGIIICGMIIETSLILYSKNRLFNDAENTVLAAANKYFHEQPAVEQINNFVRTEFCQKNSLIPEETYIDYSKINEKIIILHTAHDVGALLFSQSSKLYCNVAASIPETAYDADGIVPFAVLDEDQGADFEYGKEYILKYGSCSSNPPMSSRFGNYGALELGGTGSSTYLDNIKYGYNGTIHVGDLLTTEPGNMKNPTKEGVDYRLANGLETVVAVVTDNLPTGRGQIEVKSFAAFKLTGTGSKGEVYGKFVKLMISASSGADVPDYGVYNRSKLIFY